MRRQTPDAGYIDPVPVQEIDVDQLAARCRDQLASFKLPRAFVRVDALPKTALGKVQKHLLPKAGA